MSEMIERVAQAIVSGWEDGSFEKDPTRWREDARAAIAAMREPTEAMKVAVDASMTGVYYWRYEVKDESDSGRIIYQAMIDEALK